MLVLSRKIDQKIIVGESIVKVLGVNGKRITLGVSAPDEVIILRGELAPFGVMEDELESTSKSNRNSEVRSP
ncbi:MAG: carbon storage regulator [Planctomycetota bacterium]